MNPITLVVFAVLVTGAMSGLTKTEEDEILDLINKLRGEIKDSDPALPPVEWKHALAEMAQDWANQHKKSEHSDQIKRKQLAKANPDIEKSNIGENMAYGTSGYGIADLVNGWWNEREDYNIATATCKTGKVCGHYVQLAWAKTYAIGCGMEKYEDGGKNIKSLVCNFEPGVYGTKPPYVYKP